MLLKEFRESDITQAELGRRLDKPAEVVSRMLAGLSNMELDTLSATIFALRGGMLRFSIAPSKSCKRKRACRINSPNADRKADSGVYGFCCAS